EDDELDDWLDRFEGGDSVLQDVSARDILDSLGKLLSPREMSILEWLAGGLATREIGRRLGISHPRVLKNRRKIAILAKKLSIGPMPAGEEVVDSTASGLTRRAGVAELKPVGRS